VAALGGERPGLRFVFVGWGMVVVMVVLLLLPPLPLLAGTTAAAAAAPPSWMIARGCRSCRKRRLGSALCDRSMRGVRSPSLPGARVQSRILVLSAVKVCCESEGEVCAQSRMGRRRQEGGSPLVPLAASASASRGFVSSTRAHGSAPDTHTRTHTQSQTTHDSSVCAPLATPSTKPRNKQPRSTAQNNPSACPRSLSLSLSPARAPVGAPRRQSLLYPLG
jgi:hypothetical protein